jgi:hypothetical protein
LSPIHARIGLFRARDARLDPYLDPYPAATRRPLPRRRCALTGVATRGPARCRAVPWPWPAGWAGRGCSGRGGDGHLLVAEHLAHDLGVGAGGYLASRGMRRGSESRSNSRLANAVMAGSGPRDARLADPDGVATLVSDFVR